MTTQAEFWSKAAAKYEDDFLDPYHPGARNPLLPALEKLAEDGARDVADLGCGRGPLLPFLSRQFPTVYAVDFAPEMLRHARESCQRLDNIHFLQQPLTDLPNLVERLDVAVAINSLVMPNISDLEMSLRQICATLRPGGKFLAILPAIDAVHYYTMLLVDRALSAGRPLSHARKNAAHFAEHELYDFAFGQFFYKKLEQHFWQPFEIEYRLRRAGFGPAHLEKVLLSWDQFACGDELKTEPQPWDWFVCAEKQA